MSTSLTERLKSHIALIYPQHDPDIMAERITQAFWPDLNSERPTHEPKPLHQDLWSEKTTMMITYGDSIMKEGEKPLHTLEQFAIDHTEDFIESIHILPFFPYSSDDGFAVKDYDIVRPDLGDWHDVSRLGEKFSIMSDLVINHASAQGTWFKAFKDNVAPYNAFFYTAPADSDTSLVVRPRPSDLLVPFQCGEETKHVWCTFGDDQVDFDFSNPEVLITFIRIMRHYVDNNVSIFRMDAVAFIWKELGTNCIHLPQTHEIVRLFRTLLNYHQDNLLLITETNVPNVENLSYFGNQNEAHMIYNFSLPPLLVQALLTGNEYYLKNWLSSMPPTQDGCTYFNFVASHDGIGLRPASGILMDHDIQEMIDTIRKFGGDVSMRSIGGGLEQPYEMNVSLFDALKGTIDGEDQHQRARFLASQTIMMALAGIPAFYIHSLLATPNDTKKVAKTAHKRHINRHQWDYEALAQNLADPQSDQFYILNEIKRITTIRTAQKAFHPNATQFTMHIPHGFFGFWRQSLDRKQDIFCITNITKDELSLPLNTLNMHSGTTWVDLLSGATFEDRNTDLLLAPYQSVWISSGG